jgi:hypothetical protein
VLSLRESAASYLAQVSGRADLVGISVENVVCEGAPDETIDETMVEVFRTRHIDLVVLLGHARTRRAHWLVGSGAKGVIHDAPAPVLPLRGVARPKKPSRWSTIPPDRTVDILVPLDGSLLAEAALVPALGLV